MTVVSTSSDTDALTVTLVTDLAVDRSTRCSPTAERCC